MVELYLHSPVRLNGMVINYLSTGPSLPLPHKGGKGLNSGILEINKKGEEKR
jgi:hypothetical protein